MATIEERAELNLQYERNFCGYNLSDNMVCRAYVKGATEQKAIDIGKACEWLEEHLEDLLQEDTVRGGCELIAEFRKAMEE